jgi:hypothetical protein
MICEAIAVSGIALTCLFLYFSIMGMLFMSIFLLSYHAFRKRFYPLPVKTLPSNCGPVIKVYLGLLFTLLMCTAIVVLYTGIANQQSKIQVYLLYSLLILSIPFMIMGTVHDYKTAKQKDEIGHD